MEDPPCFLFSSFGQQGTPRKDPEEQAAPLPGNLYSGSARSLQGSGSIVHSPTSRVQSPGARVKGSRSGLRSRSGVRSLWSWVSGQNPTFRIQGPEARTKGPKSGVQGLRPRVWTPQSVVWVQGLGSRVRHPGSRSHGLEPWISGSISQAWGPRSNSPVQGPRFTVPFRGQSLFQVEPELCMRFVRVTFQHDTLTPPQCRQYELTDCSP